MKFLQTKFEEYINISQKRNLHPELVPIMNNVKNNTGIENNLIFYGPAGIGKYTQVLNYVKTFSSSNLKYERKIDINLGKKKQFMFKISDIHFEIDMELLGCNAKVLWNEIYKAILDITSTRQPHAGIIVCKNFHKIHNELLDIFYSYMQSLDHKNINISFIFVTEAISFIPDNILKRCSIINMKRPTMSTYKKCVGKNNFADIDIKKINNIKDIICKNKQLTSPNKKIVGKLINSIENYNNIKYLEFRDNIYEIFIYHLDLDECIWEIINYFVEKKMIYGEKLEKIQHYLFRFLKYYNNNYRPIYHLERLMFYICNTIHGLQ